MAGCSIITIALMVPLINISIRDDSDAKEERKEAKEYA